MHQHYGVHPGQSEAVQEELFHVISTIARHRSIAISYIDSKLTLTTR